MNEHPDLTAIDTRMNAFKNTGVYPLSITYPTSAGTGAEVTSSVSVTLTEAQQFAFARGLYVEFTKGGSAAWQTIPIFDVSVTTSAGEQQGYLIARINGATLTFIAGIKNNTGGDITISETVSIVYTTYTVDT